MKAVLAHFKDNIQRVRHLGTIYISLRAMTTPALDLSDVLRAELVLAVSALDHLVHEIARVGMLETYAGVRPQTDAYNRFRVPLLAAGRAIQAPGISDWLDEAIREAHGWLSFQQPDKIADVVRLISAVSLWETVSMKIGKPAGDIKLQLCAIVDRRNKIAHEADMDPSAPGARWPINEVLVNDAVNFVEALGVAIVDAVA